LQLPGEFIGICIDFYVKFYGNQYLSSISLVLFISNLAPLPLTASAPAL